MEEIQIMELTKVMHILKMAGWHVKLSPEPADVPRV
jgi:hypothetical protein